MLGTALGTGCRYDDALSLALSPVSLKALLWCYTYITLSLGGNQTSAVIDVAGEVIVFAADAQQKASEVTVTQVWLRGD